MLGIDINKLEEILKFNIQEPMLFNSGLFLCLFSIFFLIYRFFRNNDKGRILYIMLFSFYFYYKSSGLYLFVLLFLCLYDFITGILLDRTESVPRRKLLVFLSLAVNIGLLSYFKYTNFIFDSVSRLFNHEFEPFDIVLPVGISFFTFQSMSYIIDIYRKEIKPLTSLMDYAFYVSFFPQLVAGPIIRAKDFIPQIHRPVHITQEMFSRGIFLIIVGLFKKVVISDYISINFVDRIFENPTLYSGLENLMGVYAYALQIYCDFSGYSDMAIGIALLLGFHFNINFNSPYQSASISEFWRRWHISLSTWLKDYLYISLGGNRKSKLRTYFNLFITMVIGGIWHGASLLFIIWGAWHGLLLILHKIYQRYFKKKETELESRYFYIRKIFNVFLTFNLVCIGWVFFRATTFDSAIDIFRQIFTSFHPEVFMEFVSGYSTVLLLLLAGYLFHFIPEKYETACQNYIGKTSVTTTAFALAILIVIIIQVKSSDLLPFIYFQF